jgi:hypothetical protein
VLIDGFRSKVLWQLALQSIERRSVDPLYVEVAEFGLDPFPDMLVRIPSAVLHACRGHVLRVSVAEEDFPCAREKILARAFLREQSFGSGQIAPLPLPSESREGEVVLP